MKYQPPTGGAANDPYVGRNLGAGIQGSRIPPKAIEHPQRELVAIIAAAGITPLDTDLDQVLEALDKLYLRRGSGTPSTDKAPKLSGIIATANVGTNMANAVSTLIQYGNTVQNNLGTSTWNGNTLTVGAGEAGLWIVVATISLGIPMGGSFSSVSISQNGGDAGFGSSSLGSTGDGAAPSATTVMKCAVGDTIRAYVYQQSGATRNSDANARSRFAAFLISAY